jgi:hypothetical protein
MYTKKVIINWQKDSYLSCGVDDRDSDQATALAELDAKTTAMVAEGKMRENCVVTEIVSSPSISTIRYVTDQAAADEWLAFNDTFATTYGFVKINSVIINL